MDQVFLIRFIQFNKITMRKILSIISPVLLSFSLFAQSNDGDLRMEKTFWGVKFSEYGRSLKPKEVLQIMEVNPEAFAEFKKAKSNYDAAQVFGFIGGFMIGWPIGTAISGGDPQWGIAAGGAAVLLLTIPLNNGFTKHGRNAIAIYNDSGNSASIRPTIHLQVQGTGARVVIKF